MYCKNCGNVVEEGSRFCGNCGMKIEMPQFEQRMSQQANILQQISEYTNIYGEKLKQRRMNKPELLSSIRINWPFWGICISLLGSCMVMAGLVFPLVEADVFGVSKDFKYIDTNDGKLLLGTVIAALAFCIYKNLPCSIIYTILSFVVIKIISYDFEASLGRESIFAGITNNSGIIHTALRVAGAHIDYGMGYYFCVYGMWIMFFGGVIKIIGAVKQKIGNA